MSSDDPTCGLTSPLTSCTEACQSISNIALPSNDLTCLHYPFKLHNPHHNNHNDYDEEHGDHNHLAGSGSPVMYSNHAPILRGMGLTKCEYCGSSSVNRCEGVREVQDHFEEYQRRMFGGGGGGINNNNNKNNAVDEQDDTASVNDNNNNHNNNNNNNHNDDDAHSTSSTSTNSHPPRQCQRPKLFFLKKRPPFANSHDGWNLQTQHRQRLFEPPSSMEGVGRGYGEVRGQLGDYCTVNYASPKFVNGGGGNGGIGGGGGENKMMSMKKGYKIFQRSKSLPVKATTMGGGSSSSNTPSNNNNNNNNPTCNDACGSVCGETEVSFLSANSGRRSPVVRMSNNINNNTNNSMNGRNENDSEAGRSLSPLQWVNGSEIKGVMNWFG